MISSQILESFRFWNDRSHFAKRTQAALKRVISVYVIVIGEAGLGVGGLGIGQSSWRLGCGLAHAVLSEQTVKMIGDLVQLLGAIGCFERDDATVRAVRRATSRRPLRLSGLPVSARKKSSAIWSRQDPALEVAGYWPYIEAGQVPCPMQHQDQVAVAPELSVWRHA